MFLNKELNRNSVATEPEFTMGWLYASGADWSKKWYGLQCKRVEPLCYTAGPSGLIHSTTQAFVGTLSVTPNST